MPKSLRLLLATTALSTVALGVSVATASACGNNNGYSYAGIGAPMRAYGVSALIAPLDAFDVINGHVAGWVGVGGPGIGPHGEDEWLQVGLATFGDSNEGHLYYELTQPGQAPEYVELAAGIVPGVQVRVAVMELQFARDQWVVISPVGISGPFYLPRSHHAWEPIATAESYAESSQCNRYAYRFGGLQLTRGDGTWHSLRRAETLRDPGWRLRRHGASAFSATGI
jgi:hypothetical protein